MQYITNKEIGLMVRKVRKARKYTQKQLALAAGCGLRFISELEDGKPTCEIDKVLRILNTLGIQINLIPPKLESNDE
jgi:y4mF family transcriptional regulator